MRGINGKIRTDINPINISLATTASQITTSTRGISDSTPDASVPFSTTIIARSARGVVAVVLSCVEEVCVGRIRRGGSHGCEDRGWQNEKHVGMHGGLDCRRATI
jgi:hypothetical protein